MFVRASVVALALPLPLPLPLPSPSPRPRGQTPNIPPACSNARH